MTSAHSSVAPTCDVPLKDQVLAMLSLAARGGTTRIPILKLFMAFADLTDSFPEKFPDLTFSRNSQSAYSKQLDSAIQERVGYSIGLPNPSLQYYEISEDSAKRHLAWLEELYGSGYLESLKPIVEVLVRKLQSS
jgi:hypothetical protein